MRVQIQNLPSYNAAGTLQEKQNPNMRSGDQKSVQTHSDKKAAENMKTILISQVDPVERAQPKTAQELAEALAAGGSDLVEIQDDTAAEDITNTVMDILNDNEVFDAFVEYNEVSVEHYRIGEEICVHWQTGGYLKCGTAHEHAAEDVQDFRAYLADMEEE